LIGFLSCTIGLADDSVLAALPKLEESISHVMEKKKIPGMAVAVVYKGKVVYIKGFGVRSIKTKEPVNQHTVFQLGSVSKAISSALVLVLKQEKILHLDRPVENYSRIATRNNVASYIEPLYRITFRWIQSLD